MKWCSGMLQNLVVHPERLWLVSWTYTPGPPSAAQGLSVLITMVSATDEKQRLFLEIALGKCPK